MDTIFIRKLLNRWEGLGRVVFNSKIMFKDRKFSNRVDFDCFLAKGWFL